jgi:hypothetical protein
LASIPEIIPVLTLFIGICLVAIPYFRARFIVERRYALRDLDPGHLPEIHEFIRRRLPRASIKVNPLLSAPYAFAYPNGIRSSAIAITGGLIKLWRGNPEAAEAVLLHEIAHCRHGDEKVVGVGSLLESSIRHWPLVACITALLPAAVMLISSFSPSLNPWIGTSSWMSLLQESPTPLSLLMILACQLLGLLLYAAAAFLLPLMALWCAELNSDQWTAETQKGSASLENALYAGPSGPRRLRWTIWPLTHPPRTLRVYLVSKTTGRLRMLLLLMLYPAATAFRLLLMLGWAITGYGAIRITGGQIDLMERMGSATRTLLQRNTWTWFAMALVMAGWPLLAGRWDRMIVGSGSRLGKDTVMAYYLAALIMLVLAGALWITMSAK